MAVTSAGTGSGVAGTTGGEVIGAGTTNREGDFVGSGVTEIFKSKSGVSAGFS